MTLHEVVEVSARLEHGHLPDSLPQETHGHAQPGECPAHSADMETRCEPGPGQVLSPGGSHGHPVRHAVVHQETVP